MAIRSRYRVPQVQWGRNIVHPNLSIFLFLLISDLVYGLSQNSSLDHLLKGLPEFLGRLNSQNNVKVRCACASVYFYVSNLSFKVKNVFTSLRCGTITKDGMPWCHLSTWWTTACWEPACHPVQRGGNVASLPTIIPSTSPRSNSLRWPCKFTVVVSLCS